MSDNTKNLMLFAGSVVFAAFSFLIGYREGRKQPLTPEKENQAIFTSVETCSSVVKSYSTSFTTSSICFPEPHWDADPKVTLRIEVSGDTKFQAGNKYEIKIIPK